jgi:type II secretory pathway pseudopilin PulG
MELLVVVAIISILLGAVVAAYSGVLERAKVTKDINSLRQIGLAMQTYLNDNDQVLLATTTSPDTTGTPVLCPKYIATRRIFQSPIDKQANSETDPAPVSYSINANMYVATTATWRASSLPPPRY